MKKYFFIFLLFCSPVFLFAQTQSGQGFYQTQFFNVFGEVKVINADFEVRADQTIIGTLKLGTETKTLQGQVSQKGKFEARTLPENGAVMMVKGELPLKGSPGKASLIQRTEQRGPGSKSTSEVGLNGSIKQVPPPFEMKDVGIKDNGKTLLWFQHSTPLFGKEWVDYPAVVMSKGTAETPVIEMEMKLKTDDTERRFRFRMLVRQNAQKLWAAKDVSLASYAESKKSPDGKDGINFFLASNSGLSGGQIEIISENEKEMVFKITNFRIQRTGQDDFVQVDGYIHAAK